MGKFKVSISMSLDGYVAGPDQSEKNPLGIGGEQLHEWVVPLRAFREATESRAARSTRARRSPRDLRQRGRDHHGPKSMFGGGPGQVGATTWKGLVGDNPPFHSPGLRSHPPRARAAGDAGWNHLLLRHGWNRVGSRAGPGGRQRQDVSVGGGAGAVQQYLAAGLLDEILVSIVPLMLRRRTVRPPRRRQAPGSNKLRQSRRPESRTSNTRADPRTDVRAERATKCC